MPGQPELAKAWIGLVPTLSGAQKQIATELGGVNTSVASATVGKNFGGGMLAAFTKAIGPIAAIMGTVAVFDFGKGALGEASDLNESLNALNVVYGENAAAITKMGQEAAKSLGLSNVEANAMSVQFSAFAKTIAGDGGDVVGTLDSIQKRAADFASVMNLDVAEAATLFQSGLAGETEPLRRFGIDMSAAAVEAFALSSGLVATKGELTEAMKVQARYGLLMSQTAQTQGDFANTSEGLANRQRILGAQWDDFKAKLGKFLIPLAEKFTGFLSGLIDNISGVSSGLKDGSGPLTDFIDYFRTVGQVVGDVVTPILQTIGTILRTVVIPYLSALAEQFRQKVLPEMKKFWEMVQLKVLPPLQELWATFNARLLPKLQEFAKYMIENVVPVVTAVIAKVVEWYAAFAEKMLPILIKVVEWLVGQFADAIERTTTAINFLRSVFGPLATTILWLWENVVSPTVDRIKTAFEAVKDALGAVKDFFADKVDQIQGIFSGIADTISGAFKGAFNGISRFWNSTVGKLAFTAPSWIPFGIGGKTWEVPDMPVLDTGGIVTRPTVAMLAANSRPEAVVPLDKWDETVGSSGSGGNTWNLYEVVSAEETAQAVAARQRSHAA